MRVSEISLGTWAFGGEWGTVSEDDAYAALNRAIDLGVNFLDTADVYGDGRSEKLIGRLLKDRPTTRSSSPPRPGAASTRTPPRATTPRTSPPSSSGASGTSASKPRPPPAPLPADGGVPSGLHLRGARRVAAGGKIKNHGVSVEKVEEARMALDYPGVKTVQIIFNVFRQKPAEEFFPLAEERNIGVLARVPLASGLLSGKMSADRAFDASDHRNFNRNGEAFDRGETFSGVDFETGLRAAEELKEFVPEGHTLAQFALRWILMHPAVSCAIPGGKNPAQVEDNVAAAAMPPLSDEAMRRAREVYDAAIRPEVHHLW
jgi:aryl-alcohol dehydrogenase-like predicted oxidoreductase